MSAPLIVIAAGGTGGHMFPAQALAEEMLARGWRVQLSTDDRGARYAGGFPDAVERRIISAGTFARGGLSKLKAPFQIVGGIVSAVMQMRRDRPACVAGFGGYPTLPAMSAAWLLRLPRLIHESNGVLGRVNEVFAARVDRVACGVWPTVLPRGAQAEFTGNPVRATVAEQAGAPYDPPAEGPVHVLAIGGSQGASILSEHVPGALSVLPEGVRGRIQVAHQARPADHDAVVAAYAQAGIAAEVKPFFDDVPERLRAAHLVISRSGASTVADISVIGRPSILIPLAIAKRDEQSVNAQSLVAAGGAVMLREPELADRLSTEIAAILGDPSRAATMAAAALTLGRPQAAKTLADLAISLAEARSG